MGFHHVALATRDLDATHRFYTDVMGFTLAKAIAAPTPSGRGWARHVFYDTGGDGMIAFWDLHDETVGDFDPAISTGLGLEVWVNHLAFAARDLDDIEHRKNTWLDAGFDVAEIDHGFCVSIYTNDPNGILVEWCTDTKPYTEADAAYARAIVDNASPSLEHPPMPVFHKARSVAPA